MIRPGTKVRSKTPAGVEMGAVSVNGDQHQKRTVTGVFKRGVVLKTRTIVIDYDRWASTDAPPYLGLGKVPYRDCYVRGKNGVEGWVGVGALVRD